MYMTVEWVIVSTLSRPHPQMFKRLHFSAITTAYEYTSNVDECFIWETYSEARAAYDVLQSGLNGNGAIKIMRLHRTTGYRLEDVELEDVV